MFDKLPPPLSCDSSSANGLAASQPVNLSRGVVIDDGAFHGIDDNGNVVASMIRRQKKTQLSPGTRMKRYSYFYIGDERNVVSTTELSTIAVGLPECSWKDFRAICYGCAKSDLQDLLIRRHASI